MTAQASTSNLQELLSEYSEVKARLADAEATIEAIRAGEVDALIVRGQRGDHVFTLRGADEPYRAFVEQMVDGAVTLDAGGTILYSNHAFAAIVGQPLEQVIGKGFATFAPAIMVSESQCMPIEALVSMETTIKARDRSVPVILSSTPLDLDGPVAYAITVTDLTAQKEQEVNLRKATSELEGFCYAVSHDMRAPLRAMMANARIVLEDYGDCLPRQAIPDLQGIADSAGRLGRLMDDLLTYSRLVRQEMVMEDVDLSQLSSCIAARLVAAESEEIEWNIQAGLHAQGDSRLFEMALQNLFANAVKFSAGRRPARIRFDYDPRKEAFFVEDNGIGFDMQYVEKLFVPFERLHRHANYEGTGIGLANVKRVVERHGGRVWAESEEGRRTAFYFTLP